MVLQTLSNRLTPVMMRYALVAKELMSWFIWVLIGHSRPHRALLRVQDCQVD